MKNIISFTIIIILSACSSMETQNIKLNSVVTDREKQIVEFEKDFRGSLRERTYFTAMGCRR